MAVDFCDYFWGEKHDGFQVLYHNMKYGVLATKDLTDIVRETALIHEYNSKAYGKLSKQLGNPLNTGTFVPILSSLKNASEKLCQVHSSTLTKMNELMKELIKYSEELHKKHKQIKDEESPTSDTVKSLQDTTNLLQKSKEAYKARTAELEKLKRDNPSQKELEKAETKYRKAQEEYKNLVDKYSHVREDFEKKMLTSCKHFQKAETLYLTQMVDFVHSYHELIDRNHNQVGKVNLELEENLVQNTVERMLEQFVLQKYTGLVKPGPVEFEEEKISLTSLNAAITGGGPPSDISDRSANSDRTSEKAVSGASGLTAGPGLTAGSGVTAGGATALPKKEGSGFLKNRRKKERSKKGKGKEEGETENKDIGSDGEERGRSETPTPDQIDDEGYSQPPPVPAPAQATDPWADFHQTNKKSFYSSSESDSDDEEIKKIKVHIKPVTAANRSATSASVDELQKAVGGIDLMAATLPKRFTPTLDYESTSSAGLGGVKRSQSTNLVGGAPRLGILQPATPTTAVATPPTDTSSNSNLFLAMAGTDNTVDLSTVSGGAPGAESTRLDNSNNSSHNKEVSDLLNDIHDLNLLDSTSTSTALNATALSSAWPDDTPTGGGAAAGGAGWDANSTPWPEAGGGGWGSSVDQPAIPPKQNTARPASVQREKIASSLISLPRPPSRARPEPRMRGTPSPTPTSLLQSTALSIARSDSLGSSRGDFLLERKESLGSNPGLKTRSDSVGSTNSYSESRTGPMRAGPYFPAPSSSSRPIPPPRSDSPPSFAAPPPPGPAPPLLPHHSSSGGPAFGTSRGPSPLTLGTGDTVPLAVAFQEVVHAAFRGSDESRCLVRLLGDMMLSFPAGIVNILATNPYPAPLQFRINNAKRLESVLPNKQLISKVKNQCTEDCLVFEFNMSSLQELLDKQSQINPTASYFNIDILKYQVAALPGAASCPFQMVSYWKCEGEHTDLRLDFKYNQHAMARTSPLLNVNLAVPVDGGVVNMTSQPKGIWNPESNRALWKFPDLSMNHNGGVGAIRARFQLSDGPGSQSTIAAQFNCEGTTLSGVEFELTGSGYRVSLVKRRFVSGKYVSEPDYSTDKYRYAAPPGMPSDC